MSSIALEVLYGLGIGLALGITGGGGSIVTLPVLVYLVGEGVHEAIGTSLAIVGAIAAHGFIAQRRNVRFGPGALVGLLGVLGNIPGSMLAAHVTSTLLLLLFSGFMIAAAAAMLFVRIPDQREGQKTHWLTIAVVGAVLGFLTGFLGVGGGFLIVPALVFALGFPMRCAVATSLFVIFANTVVALIARVGHVQIDWTVSAIMFGGGMVGMVAGGWIARHLDAKRLKAIFAYFVLGVGLFTASSALHLIPVSVK